MVMMIDAPFYILNFQLWLMGDPTWRGVSYYWFNAVYDFKHDLDLVPPPPPTVPMSGVLTQTDPFPTDAQVDAAWIAYDAQQALVTKQWDAQWEAKRKQRLF